MRSNRTITDIDSLIGAVTRANERFDGQVWWRGQRDSTWSLTPSVARLEEYKRSEQSLIARFKHKAASRHPRVPDVDDYPSWLFLMQHYRLPTRLLDWTESPLIACFFATEANAAKLENEQPCDVNGALFALDPYALNKNQARKEVLFLPNEDQPSSLIKKAFESDGPDVKKILAIRPSEVDPRLMVQLAVFTLHGAEKSIEDIEGWNEFTIKFIVAAGRKTSLRRDLKLLGIRESSVFPDLEHLARDIASTRFKERGAPEMFNIGNDIEDYGGEVST